MCKGRATSSPYHSLSIASSLHLDQFLWPSDGTSVVTVVSSDGVRNCADGFHIPQATHYLDVEQQHSSLALYLLAFSQKVHLFIAISLKVD